MEDWWTRTIQLLFKYHPSRRCPTLLRVGIQRLGIRLSAQAKLSGMDTPVIFSRLPWSRTQLLKTLVLSLGRPRTLGLSVPLACMISNLPSLASDLCKLSDENFQATFTNKQGYASVLPRLSH